MWVEHLLGVPLNIVILCLIAGATRIFVAADAVVIKSIAATMLSALFFAVIAYPYLQDEDYRKGLATFMVAIGSFAAKDLFGVLIKLMAQMQVDPLALLREWLNLRAKGKNPEDNP